MLQWLVTLIGFCVTVNCYCVTVIGFCVTFNCNSVTVIVTVTGYSDQLLCYSGFWYEPIQMILYCAERDCGFALYLMGLQFLDIGLFFFDYDFIFVTNTFTPNSYYHNEAKCYFCEENKMWCFSIKQSFYWCFKLCQWE